MHASGAARTVFVPRAVHSRIPTAASCIRSRDAIIAPDKNMPASPTHALRKPPMMSQRSLLMTLLCAAWILPGLFHDPWKPDEAYTFG